jgi:thiamine kinase-like enzyme
VNSEAYVLRLPGGGTSDYIDRAAEERNARIASAAGINAATLFFDASDGLMLSRFVEGTIIDETRLNSDPETLARVARSLRRVHRFDQAFKTRFDVFAEIDAYMALLREMRTPLSEDFGEVKREARAIRRALESAPMPLAPCHNDPWPRNFLDAGGRIYIIDWEYSGMNDPMWDLGDLSVEAGFGPEQDRTMMEAYYGGYVPPTFYARLALYKTMSDLLWAVWGFVQHANGNVAEDFRAYALERLEHCVARMNDVDFARNLVIAGSDRQPYVSRARFRVDTKRNAAAYGAPRQELAGSPPSPAASRRRAGWTGSPSLSRESVERHDLVGSQLPPQPSLLPHPAEADEPIVGAEPGPSSRADAG